MSLNWGSDEKALIDEQDQGWLWYDYLVVAAITVIGLGTLGYAAWFLGTVVVDAVAK